MSDARSACLETLKFSDLRNGKEEQLQKLFNACQRDGVFYLDLTGFETDRLFDTILQDMFGLERHIFNLPEEEKLQYDVDKTGGRKVCGYKPVGRNTGGITGKQDGFETFMVPKDHIIGIKTYPLPPVIAGNLSTLKNFTAAMLVVNEVILSSLSASLSLSASQSLQACHRPTESSPDIIRFLRYQAQPADEHGAPHQPHTDLGTTTILFSVDPGLQVMHQGSDQWDYIAPKPRHAIVNLGDGMKLLTNGLFHSCLHRVAPPPGKAMSERYSLVYTMRAEDQTIMTGCASPLIPARTGHSAEIITSGEWLERKFAAMRKVTRDEGQDWRLVGGQAGACGAVV